MSALSIGGAMDREVAGACHAFLVRAARETHGALRVLDLFAHVLPRASAHQAAANASAETLLAMADEAF